METQKAIIFTNENGGVSVCVPTGEIPVEQVQSKDIPVGIKSHIVDHASLPWEHNDFFDAWEQTNGVVTVNLDKSKHLTKERLRAERAALLAAQDVAFQRALETGQPTTDIVAEKQRLRDLPVLVDTCVNLDELRALKAEK